VTDVMSQSFGKMEVFMCQDLVVADAGAFLWRNLGVNSYTGIVRF
jgi:hypothetical protein